MSVQLTLFIFVADMCIYFFFFFFRKRVLRTANDIIDALEEEMDDKDEEEVIDDSDADQAGISDCCFTRVFSPSGELYLLPVLT